MPFQSKSQRKWMYANNPEMAKRWEKETPKDKPLPEYKRSRNNSLRNAIKESRNDNE